MSARLSLEEIRNFSWKGKTFSQITAGISKNSRTGTLTPRLTRNALPLKIYRKEIASSGLKSCSHSTVLDFETPGGSIVNSKATNKYGLANTVDPTIPKNSCEIPGNACESTFSNTNLQNRCISNQNNALRRVRSSGMIKRSFKTNNGVNNLKYYTDSAQYLDSRNLTFQQNEYHLLRQGDSTSLPGSAASSSNVYASNTVAHCANPNTNYVPVYYKPNNSKFAQQGSVTSSTRIQRLKYDTITNAGSKLQSTFGKETANALAYSTTNSSVYSLKQKVGYPNKKTPVFSKVTGKLSCNTCVAPFHVNIPSGTPNNNPL